MNKWKRREAAKIDVNIPKSGCWRCPLCDEPISNLGPKHDKCPKDLMPGAYWDGQ